MMLYGREGVGPITYVRDEQRRPGGKSPLALWERANAIKGTAPPQVNSTWTGTPAILILNKDR